LEAEEVHTDSAEGSDGEETLNEIEHELEVELNERKRGICESGNVKKQRGVVDGEGVGDEIVKKLAEELWDDGGFSRSHILPNRYQPRIIP
jgi:hypothetical protein